MNKLKAMAFAAVMVGLAGGESAAQSRLQDILESGTLRVGTTGDFNPMSYKDPASGDYVGYDIDAVKKLAADMEVDIEFVPTDWKTLVNGVVADKYDLTTSASMSMARAKVAGFSEPYVEFSTVPVMLASNAENYDGWDAMNVADVKVAVTLGTVFEEQARAYFDTAEIITVEAPARGYQEVLAGRATATITSNVDAAQLTSNYPELAIVEVDKPRSRRPGAFLLAQDDQVWLNYVNHWVRLNHTNGFFEELQAKWNIAR